MAELLVDSPAVIIATLLQELGLGISPVGKTTAQLATEWPIYYSGEPNEPDNVITIYDTQGQLDGVTTPDRAMNEHVGFQVRVRARQPKSGGSLPGWQKANQIAVSLLSQVDHALVTCPSGDSYIVYSCLQKGSINSLGKESPSSHRRLYTVNFIAAIGNQSTG